ncbi:hypothetical protein QJQ45_005979 [Haematococcus lacustris]|nr:hypothetical protein QJQ45_005979 [Haematococcus lacustris]
MLALDPLLSCAWDSTEFNGKDPHVHQRLRFFGRAIRLGYNVLQLDGDTVIFRDPYVYLKRPPLAGINLLTSFESGPDTRNNNIGMVYAQNTRPDGPTAWVFRWLVEITLRWMDDGGLFAREQCGDAYCVGFDQALMHGAVSTAQLGRPVFLSMQIVRKNRNTEATKGAREAEQALLRVMELCNHPDVRMVVLPALSVAQPELGFKTHLHDFSNLYFHNMTVPNLAYGYPPALGGRLFAEVPNGSYSSAWHAQLRDDCPDCPWWDEQRPLKGGSDSLVGPAGELLLQTATRGQFVEDHLPKEIIAQGPGWFVQSMTIHRQATLPTHPAARMMVRVSVSEVAQALHTDSELHQQSPWQPPSHLHPSAPALLHAAPSPPMKPLQQFGTWLGPGVAPLGSHMVIGHVHGWRKQQSQGYKIVVRKMTGRYNWTLAAQLTAPKAPYMVAQPGSSLKLLALAPHIDLERTRDLAEFNTIVLGLLQAALLSKRVAVLPQLPCETPWLHGQKMDDEHRPTDQRCIAPLFNGPNQDWPAPLPFPITPASKQLLGSWTHWSNCSNNLGLLPRDPPLDVEAAQHDSQFWAKQRYSTTLTYLMDQSCAGDVGGLLPPEYAHWLQCEAPAGTQVHSSSSNTVLQVSPNDRRLHLQPSSWPGGERFRLAPGSVLQANTSRGWSWRDVQVSPAGSPCLLPLPVCPQFLTVVMLAAVSHSPELGPQDYEPEPTLWGAADVQVSVSTREVARQLHQVAQQPLVYLGHPILLAPPRPGDRVGEVDSKAGEGTARHLRTDQLAVGDVEARGGRYRRVMKRLRGSFCRAMFADSAQEAHRDNIVLLTEEHLAAACPMAHVDRDGFLQLLRH